MKQLLHQKAGKHRIELYWYFVPGLIAIFTIGLAIILVGIGGPPSYGANRLAAGLIMPPTVFYDAKYATRGVKRLWQSER